MLCARPAIIALAAAFLLPMPARAATVTFHCTNPASGARWDIVVDFARHLAGSFPAEITPRRISWRDTRHGGLYDLDRMTGRLTVRFASSTGGYFLHDTCEIPPASSRRSEGEGLPSQPNLPITGPGPRGARSGNP